MGKTVIVYKDSNGKTPYFDWLFNLKDHTVRYRVVTRIDRVRHGNYGDHKRFHNIIELILDFGKGYRVYFGEADNTVVVLLRGGDKSTQEKDIKKALSYWEDYNEKK